MLPSNVRRLVEHGLGRRIARASGLPGGCIAHATRIETDAGPVFLKWVNDEPRTLQAEADGLEALQSAETGLIVPEVLYVGREVGEEHLSVLVLEWLDSEAATAGAWARMGTGLAELHHVTSGRYGFASDNFIGRLPQTNTWSQDWSSFFLECRLGPQVERARHEGRWPSNWDVAFRHLVRSIADVLPAHPPASLLHGDLWIGNVMVTPGGVPALIDPAVYYGHAEADLAMARLFGGFDSRFYDAYHAASPREAGFEERAVVYELYHVINHLNHFGEAYAPGVARRLERYL